MGDPNDKMAPMVVQKTMDFDTQNLCVIAKSLKEPCSILVHDDIWDIHPLIGSKQHVH